MKTKQQKSILGKTTGSLVNYLMGNNKTLPIVGEGATVLMHSDRHACEVLAVSDDCETVCVADYIPERTDTNGMSECQDYKYEKISEHIDVLVWRKNGWKRVIQTVEFVDSFYKEYKARPDNKKAWEEMIKPLFEDGHVLSLVPGKTRLKTTYDPISIIFGVKEEYYDFSF